MRNDDPMSSLQPFGDAVAADPLESVESFLNDEGMAFERTPEGDIGFALAGDWRTYEMWFSWRPEAECLQLCCALDVESGVGKPLADARVGGLLELMALVNQHVWFGHFEMFRDTEVPGGPVVYDVVYRHTVSIPPLDQASSLASAHMINAASETVDRFYPAFEFWFKGAFSAQDAFSACLFETVGEA